MTNWTIRKRISAGYAAVVAVTIAIGLFGYVCLGLIQQESTSLVDDSLPGIIALTRVQANMRENYGLIEKHILTTEASAFPAIEQRLREISTENNDLLKQAEATILTTQERALFETLNATRTEYRKSFDAVLELSRANKKTAAFELFTRTADVAFKKYDAALQAEVDYNVKQGQTSGASIASTVSASHRFTAIGVSVALLLAIGIGYLITRSINRILVSTTHTIAEGAAQVASASDQVSKSSQSLAQGASEQAASLEETSSSLEELSSMTRHNAESAATAKDLSTQTRAAADTGHADMTEMRTAMDAIKTSSADIAKIIKSIDEIAFQTNILALNAAVEAARAGEAGMGFAVVAEEVRALAQRSANSAKETASKIEVAIRNGEHGVLISDKVAQSLGVIVEKARKVDEIVAEIATASHEQNQGIGQINTAVSQMDKVTQSNAGSAEETAAAAEELNAQSVTLKESVTHLRQLVGGGRQHAIANAAPAHTTLTKSAPPAKRGAPSALKTPAPHRLHQPTVVTVGQHDGFFKDS